MKLAPQPHTTKARRPSAGVTVFRRVRVDPGRGSLAYVERASSWT